MNTQTFDVIQPSEYEKNQHINTGVYQIQQEQQVSQSRSAFKFIKFEKTKRLIFQTVIAKHFLLIIINIVNNFSKFTGCLKAEVVDSANNKKLGTPLQANNLVKNQQQKREERQGLTSQQQTVKLIFMFECQIQQIDQQWASKYQILIRECWQKQIKAATDSIGEVLFYCCKNKISISKFQYQLQKRLELNFQKSGVND